MKKILVTGATGKVGSRFVPRLLSKGYDVSILVRDASKASALAELGANVVVGDLYSTDTLPPAVEGIDAVVHLAALFRTFTDNEGIIKTNHAGTVTLANASMGANQIVANQLILAKALNPLFIYRPLKGTAMNLSALVPHIAVGFNQRIKSCQSKALAKLSGFIIQSNKRPI